MPTRIIAIDWSGAAHGARRKIWLAEVSAGHVVRLECGRDRVEIATHLIEETRHSADMIVGLDFAFSLPMWFLHERGLRSAPELWAMVAGEGDQWLVDCTPPFWGRPGKQRPDLPDPFRRADRDIPAVGGIRPKSVFQIGGAGAVGTGSLRGMPILLRLREAGFAVWPFDAPRYPLVVEIYPRALTSAVVKGNAEARRRYLAARLPSLESKVLHLAAASDDAFDALVSAIVMAEHVGELTALPRARDSYDELEGRIWTPRGSTAVRPVQPIVASCQSPPAGLERYRGNVDIERLDRPGDDTDAWRAALRDMLPAPVEEGEYGELIGGAPGEVVATIRPDQITISRFALRWESQRPVSDPVAVATFRLAEGRTRDVAKAIARARAARVRTYRWCVLCRKITPPEWLHDPVTCQECAQRYLGVVY